MKVLIVDDEKLIVKGLKFSLEQDSMQVDCAYDGEEALMMVKKTSYDVILLDVMLPKLSGFEVCQQIREFSDVPILLLTAKSEIEDKVLGLNVGADDYITKPFAPVEVLARVRSALRRYANFGRPREPGLLSVGSISLDDRTKTVAVDDEPVSLTPIEYGILKLLMENPGKVYSTRKLYEAVWQEPAIGNEGAVAVHIRHLREKLEINPSEPRYLKVVWGQGYKIEGGK